MELPKGLLDPREHVCGIGLMIDSSILESAVGNGEIRLFIPAGDVTDPELSIVIPALNEELTIGEFVDWCKEGLRRSNVRGEILIIDSSNDATAEIALARGARVLKTPKRGLGRAYIDAIPYIRGKYTILGDADLTYDFRKLEPFVEQFHRGAEYLMGSRFKGSIEKGAMPPLHRYFGNPLTTRILNILYGSRFSDIHCGMRGVTRDALQRMELRSQSWQYASEMVIKSIHLGLRTSEVPVTFYKDFEGRQSHHRRIGWWSPWVAGWISIQAMLIWGADFFLIRPGLLLLLIGGIGVGALFNGPIVIGNIGFSLHWMLLFLMFYLVGLQLLLMGILARVVYGYKDREKPWQIAFRFNPAIVISSVLLIAGILSILPLVREYVSHNYRLPSSLTATSFQAVGGLGMVMWSFIHFTYSMVYNAVRLSVQRVEAVGT
jgi:glycosyltransferase involved in cell wall biosynthesis